MSMCRRCYSQRKVKNSESKSQLVVVHLHMAVGCYSQRKVKNSESKSQPNVLQRWAERRCYSQRKVKNSESKSQPDDCLWDLPSVVIHSVKLKILKANHNLSAFLMKI